MCPPAAPWISRASLYRVTVCGVFKDVSFELDQSAGKLSLSTVPRSGR
jgi:hypothetical protein